MSLYELRPEERIYFLQEFVQELVINSAHDEELKEIIEAEKIKIKYLEAESNKPFEELGAIHFLNKNVQGEELMRKSIEVNESLLTPRNQKERTISVPIRKNPVTIMPLQLKKRENTPISYNPVFSKETISEEPHSSMISPVSNPLLKILPLMNDLGIQLIECPGAGKFILVKVRNKINTTKITLKEEEIEFIINHFAQQAQIPIVGGILKAAVGDMLISAVLSKYVGSRFIITKKSPYELLEGQTQ